MVTSEREPIMSMVQLSRDRLRRNTRYVDMIAAQSMMFVGGDDDEYDCGGNVDDVDGDERRRRVKAKPRCCWNRGDTQQSTNC